MPNNTDLLSQIEAAAAMGEKAKDAARMAEAQMMDPNGRAASLASQHRYAMDNLPLAAIAEELRTAHAAREAAERRLGFKEAEFETVMAEVKASRDRLAAECESLRAEIVRLRGSLNVVAWPSQYGHGQATPDFFKHLAQDTLAIGVPVANERAAEAARLAGKESPDAR